MRVFFRAGFDSFSGYGQDGIDIARFLARQGVDVVPFPTSCLPPLPREFTALLEKDPRAAPGKKYDVALCFGPPNYLQPDKFTHFGNTSVGWTMWEKLPMIPQDMRGSGFGRRRSGYWTRTKHPLDLMLVTTPMNVDALQPLDPALKIETLPCGIDGDAWPVVPRNIDRPMTFGMIGMLVGRKDPFTMLNVWRELYDEVPGFDAVLKLHTMTEGMHPQIAEWLPNCVLTERAMSKAQLVDWYHSVDVLVSTSRGEGNNKPAMEMMATGGTVIATDWSGHQNWLMPDATYALGGQLMAYENGVQDFRADPDHLKELIVRCWRNRSEVASKGRVASRWIRESLSWDKVTTDLERRLEKLILERS